jgi:hypothetical protein
MAEVPASGSAAVELVAYGAIWTLPLLSASVAILLAARRHVSSVGQLILASSHCGLRTRHVGGEMAGWSISILVPIGNLGSPPSEPALEDTKRILVVDDEPVLCALASRVLREAGHEVVAAADGTAASARAAWRRKPALRGRWSLEAQSESFAQARTLLHCRVERRRTGGRAIPMTKPNIRTSPIRVYGGRLKQELGASSCKCCRLR